jgi:DnaK suppressor protein
MDQLNHAELNDEGDFASASSESMIDQVITTQQSKELTEIDYALGKIKNGSYGTCEMCEEHIDKDRLKVKPHAKYCIVCREIVEKSGTNK